MKKNLDPAEVPEMVASRMKGGETPCKESLCRYVQTAELAFAHGLRGVAEYQRAIPALRAARVRSLELWFRKELGCKN